jgi:nucleoside-diphosphate-sugar epimerase
LQAGQESWADAWSGNFARGHSVVGLARSSKGEELVRSFGGEPCVASLLDAHALARAAQGSEVVVNAATAIPTKLKTNARDWEMNDRIGREGTQALASAAAKTATCLFLQQSLIWVALEPGQPAFDEDSPTHRVSVYVSALDAEEISREAGQKAGFQVGILRSGTLYSNHSAHTRSQARLLMKRKLPLVGQSRHMPNWLAQLVTGKQALDYVTTSARTSNVRIRR